MSVTLSIFGCIMIFIGAYALGYSKGWGDGFNKAESIYKAAFFEENEEAE